MEEIKKKLVDIFKLEDRVLYDAAGAADIVAAAEADAQAQQQAAEQAAEEARQAAEEAAKLAPPENPAAAAAESAAADVDAADDGMDVDSLIEADFAEVDDADMDEVVSDDLREGLAENDSVLYAEAFSQEVDAVRELVVINSSVKDAQKIIDSLSANTDVLVLENGKDGLDQINDYLDANSGVKYSALHIVSHGNAGYFTLCGEVIDGEAVANDPASWASIGEHLTDDSDIMLYACNLAGNEEGQLLVSQIASLTNADVAASADTTGVRGNWDLEYSIGAVENEFISASDYNHNLVSYTVGSFTTGTEYRVNDNGEYEQGTYNAETGVWGDYKATGIYTWSGALSKSDVTEIILNSTITADSDFAGKDVTISGSGALTLTGSEIAGNVVFTTGVTWDSASNAALVSGTVSVTGGSLSFGADDLSLTVEAGGSLNVNNTLHGSALTGITVEGVLNANGINAANVQTVSVAGGDFTVDSWTAQKLTSLSIYDNGSMTVTSSLMLGTDDSVTTGNVVLTNGSLLVDGASFSAAKFDISMSEGSSISLTGTSGLEANSISLTDSDNSLNVESDAAVSVGQMTVNGNSTITGGGTINVEGMATLRGDQAVLSGTYGSLTLGAIEDENGDILEGPVNFTTQGNVTVLNNTVIEEGVTWDIGTSYVVLGSGDAADTLTHRGYIIGHADADAAAYLRINITSTDNVYGTVIAADDPDNNLGVEYTKYGEVTMDEGTMVHYGYMSWTYQNSPIFEGTYGDLAVSFGGTSAGNQTLSDAFFDYHVVNGTMLFGTADATTINMVGTFENASSATTFDFGNIQYDTVTGAAMRDDDGNLEINRENNPVTVAYKQAQQQYVLGGNYYKLLVAESGEKMVAGDIYTGLEVDLQEIAEEVSNNAMDYLGETIISDSLYTLSFELGTTLQLGDYNLTVYGSAAKYGSYDAVIEASANSTVTYNNVVNGGNSTVFTGTYGNLVLSDLGSVRMPTMSEALGGDTTPKLTQAAGDVDVDLNILSGITIGGNLDLTFNGNINAANPTQAYNISVGGAAVTFNGHVGTLGTVGVASRSMMGVDFTGDVTFASSSEVLNVTAAGAEGANLSFETAVNNVGGISATKGADVSFSEITGNVFTVIADSSKLVIGEIGGSVFGRANDDGDTISFDVNKAAAGSSIGTIGGSVYGDIVISNSLVGNLGGEAEFVFGAITGNVGNVTITSSEVRFDGIGGNVGDVTVSSLRDDFAVATEDTVDNYKSKLTFESALNTVGAITADGALLTFNGNVTSINGITANRVVAGPTGSANSVLTFNGAAGITGTISGTDAAFIFNGLTSGDAVVNQTAGSVEYNYAGEEGESQIVYAGTYHNMTVVAGDVAHHINGETAVTGIFANSGAFVIDDGGVLNVSRIQDNTAASYTINAGGTLNFDATDLSPEESTVDGSVNNYGTLGMEGNVTFSNTVTNYSTLTVDSAATFNILDNQEEGTLNLADSGLTIASLLNSGLVNITATGMGLTSIRNTGELRIALDTAATAYSFGNNLQNNGTINVEKGSLTLNAFQQGLRNDSDELVEADNARFVTGANGTLTFATADAELVGSFDNAGTMIFNNAYTVRGAETDSFANSGTVTVNDDLTLGVAVENNGKLTGTDVTVTFNNATSGSGTVDGLAAVYDTGADSVVFGGSYTDLTLDNSNYSIAAGSEVVVNDLFTLNSALGGTGALTLNGTTAGTGFIGGNEGDALSASYAGSAELLDGVYLNLSLATDQDATRTVTADVTVNGELAFAGGSVVLEDGVKLGGTITGEVQTLTIQGAAGVVGADGAVSYAEFAETFSGNVAYVHVGAGDQVVFGGSYQDVEFTGSGAFILTGNMGVAGEFALGDDLTLGGADADSIYSLNLNGSVAGAGLFNGFIDVTYGDAIETVYGGSYNDLTLIALANGNTRSLAGITVEGAFVNAGTTEVTDDSVFNGTIGGSGAVEFSGMATGSALVVGDADNAVAITYSAADDGQQIFAGVYYGALSLTGGSKYLTAGTAEVPVITTISGDLATNQEIIIGTGSHLILTGSGEINIQDVTLDGGILESNRALDFGTLTINSGSEFILGNSETTFDALINNGTLTVSADYTFGNNSSDVAILTNAGVMNISVTAAVILQAGTYANGTINNSGSLELASAGSDFGTVVNDNELNVTADVTFSKLMTNNGTISGNADISFGEVAGNGTVNMTGGSVTYTVENTNMFVGTYHALTIANGGVFAAGTTTINGDFDISNGSVQIGAESYVALAGSGSATINELVLDGGTLESVRAIEFGALTIGAGSEFILNNAGTTFDSLTNNGTLTVGVDYTFGDDETVVNENGTINVREATSVTLLGGTYSDTVIANAGTLNIGDDANSVDLTLTGLTSSGTVSVAADSVLTLDGAEFILGGTVNGEGSINNENGTVAFTGPNASVLGGSYNNLIVGAAGISGDVTVGGFLAVTDENGSIAGDISLTLKDSASVDQSDALSDGTAYYGIASFDGLNVTYEAGYAGGIVAGTYGDLTIGSSQNIAVDITVNGNAVFAGTVSATSDSDLVFNGSANSGTIDSAGSVTFTAGSALDGTYNLLTIAGSLGAANVTVNGTLTNAAEGAIYGSGSLVLNGNIANVTVVEGTEDGYLDVLYSGSYTGDILDGEFGDLTVSGSLADAVVTVHGVLDNTTRYTLSGNGSLTMAAGAGFGANVTSFAGVVDEETTSYLNVIYGEGYEGAILAGSYGNLEINGDRLDLSADGGEDLSLRNGFTVYGNASLNGEVEFNDALFTFNGTNVMKNIYGNGQLIFSYTAQNSFSAGADYQVTMDDGSSVEFHNNSILSGTYFNLFTNNDLGSANITVNGTYGINNWTAIENWSSWIVGSGSLTFGSQATIDDSVTGVDLYRSNTVTIGGISVTYLNSGATVLEGHYQNLNIGDGSERISLTTNGNVTVHGAAALNNAVLESAENSTGELYFLGAVNGDNSYIGNTGKVIYTGSGNVVSGSYNELVINAAMDVIGAVTVNGSVAGKALTIKEGGALNLNGTEGQAFTGAVTVENGGELSINADVTFGSTLVNAGLVYVNSDYTFGSVNEETGVTTNVLVNTGAIQIAKDVNVTVDQGGELGSFVNLGNLTFNKFATVGLLANSGTVSISTVGTAYNSPVDAEGLPQYDEFVINEFHNYIMHGEDAETTYGTLNVDGSYTQLVLKTVVTGSNTTSESVITVAAGNQLSFKADAKQTIYGTVDVGDADQIYFENTFGTDRFTYIHNFVSEGWIVVDTAFGEVETVEGNNYWVITGGSITILGDSFNGTQFKVDGGELIFADGYVWDIDEAVSELNGGSITIADGAVVTFNGSADFAINSTIVNAGTLTVIGEGFSFSDIAGTGMINGSGSFTLTENISGSQTVNMTAGTVTYLSGVSSILAGTYANANFNGQTVNANTVNSFIFNGTVSGNATITLDGTKVKEGKNTASFNMTKGSVIYSAAYAENGVLNGTYYNLVLGEGEDVVDSWTISRSVTVNGELDAIGVARNLTLDAVIGGSGVITNTPQNVTYTEATSGSSLLGGDYQNLTLLGDSYTVLANTAVTVNKTLNSVGTGGFGVQITVMSELNLNGSINDGANTIYLAAGSGTINFNGDDLNVWGAVGSYGGTVNFNGANGTYTGVVGIASGNGVINITGTGNEFAYMTNAVGWYNVGLYVTGQIASGYTDNNNSINAPKDVSYVGNQAGSGIADYNGTINIDLGDEGTVTFNREFVTVANVNILSGKSVVFAVGSQLAVAGGNFTVSADVQSIQFGKVDIAYYFNAARDTKFHNYAQKSEYNNLVNVYDVQPHSTSDWVWDNGSRKSVNEEVAPNTHVLDVRVGGTSIFNNAVKIRANFNKTSFIVDGSATFKDSVTSISGSYHWENGDDSYPGKNSYIAPEYVYFVGNSNGSYEGAVMNYGSRAEMYFSDNNIFHQTVTNTAQGRLNIQGSENVFNDSVINNYFLRIDGVNTFADIKNSSSVQFTNAGGSQVGVSVNTGLIDVGQNSDGIVFTNLVNSGKTGTINIEADIIWNTDIVNNGTISINNALVEFNGSITNNEGAKFDIKGDFGSVINGKVTNAGEFFMTADNIVVNSVFTNTGLLSIAGANFYMAELNNSGVVSVSAINGLTEQGNLIDNLILSGSGELNVVGSGYLYINKYADVESSVVTVSDNGILNFRDKSDADVKHTVNALVTVKGNGDVIYDPAQTTFVRKLDFLDWIIIEEDAVLNGNVLTINGQSETVNMNGKFRVIEGATLTVESIGQNARFSISSGVLELNGSDITIGNIVDIGLDSELVINGENIHFTYEPEVGYAFNNAGTVTVNGSVDFGTAETGFTQVLNTGSITVNGEANFLNALFNEGSIVIAAAGTVSGKIANSGSVSVAGALAVDGSVLGGTVVGNNGSITSSSSDTLEFTGAVSGNAVFDQNIIYSGSTVMGGIYNGSLTLNGTDALMFNSSTTVNGELINNSGMMISGDATVVTLNAVSSASAANSYDVAAGSQLIFNEGVQNADINNSGSITFAAESSFGELVNIGTMEYAFENANYHAVAGSTGTVIFSAMGANITGDNYGTINVVASAAMNLDSNNGTLNLGASGDYVVNANTGVINVAGDGVELDTVNAGTVNVSGANAILRGSNNADGVVAVSGADTSIEMAVNAGTVKVADGATVSINTAVFTGTLDNVGRVTVNEVVDLTNILAGNNGVVALANGGLTLAGQTVKGWVEIENADVTVNDTTKVLNGAALDFEVDRDLDFSVLTEGTGKINVSENSTLTVTVPEFSSNFAVEEGSTIKFASSPVTVSGNAENNGTINAETIVFTGNTSGNGVITSDTILSVAYGAGNTVFGGIYDNLTINGGATIGADITVTNSATFNGDIVNNAAITGDSIDFNGDLVNNGVIDGDFVYVQGDAVNNGSMTADNVTFDGKTSGNGTVNAFNAVYAGGEIFSGNYEYLTVNGSSTLNGTVEVNDMNLHSTLGVEGTLAIAGAANGNGTINSINGTVNYVGDDQVAYNGQYHNIGLNNTQLNGDIRISGKADGTFVAGSESEVTYNGTGVQDVLAGSYNVLSLVNGTKMMAGGETYQANVFNANGVTLKSTNSDRWILNAGDVNIHYSDVNDAYSDKLIILDGTNTGSNCVSWSFYNAYGAVGDAAPGIDNANFSALASQLSAQLLGDELEVLYEDDDIFFRRRGSMQSVDDIRNVIEGFADEIDIENFGAAFYGIELEEELVNEMAMAEALANEADAALMEIVENE